MKIEDLKLGQNVLLSDSTRGEIISLYSQTARDWEGIDFDFQYITEVGQVRQADVLEIIEIY